MTTTSNYELDYNAHQYVPEGFEKWMGSNALGASNEPVLNRLEIHDRAGFEAFYTAALTPWLQVTANIRYIDSALSGTNLPDLEPLPALKLPGLKEA